MARPDWRLDAAAGQAITIILFVLEPTDISVGLRNERATVSDFPDGRIEISYKGVVLPYRIFDKHQRVSQATIVENKFLDGVLEFIRTKQLEEPLTAPAAVNAAICASTV